MGPAVGGTSPRGPVVSPWRWEVGGGSGVRCGGLIFLMSVARPGVPVSPFKATLLTCLLLATAFAGCASDAPVDDSGDGFVDDGSSDPDDGSSESPPSSGAPDDEFEDSPRGRFEQALESFSSNATAPRHFLYEVNKSEGEGASTVYAFYFDSGNHTTYYRSEGLTATGKRSESVNARVHVTDFYGREVGQVRASRDASAEPFSSFEERGGQATLVAYATPTHLNVISGVHMLRLDSPDSSEETTRDGVPVEVLTYEASREGVPPTTVTLQKSPLRLLSIQLVQDQGESSPLAFVNVTVKYGQAAVTPFVETLVRAETLTYDDIASAEAYDRVRNGYEEGLKNWTWTVMPAAHAPRVALAEAELRVEDRYREGITLDLSAGSAEDGAVRVTFTDADSDGFVGEGDSFTLVVLDESKDVADYRVSLLDEKTGLRLVAA